jgi:multidrug efflux pump subunit AcrA (membrane-fusion protein)
MRNNALAPAGIPRHRPAPQERLRLVYKRPKRRRGWFFLIAGLLLAGFIWIQQATGPARKAAPAPIRTAKAKTGIVARTLRVTGLAAAENAFTLRTPMLEGNRRSSGGSSGDFTLELTKVVDPGSRVRKGDVVAEFDRQYMLDRLDNYQASMVQHQASVKKRLANLELRRKTFEQRTLMAKGNMEKAAIEMRRAPVLSAIAAEQLRLAYEEAKARYEQVLKDEQLLDISEVASLRRDELDLREARLELDRAQANVDKMAIKAPIDGLTVMMSTSRYSQTSQIKKGDALRGGQPYMQIVDLGSMVVNAMANQSDVQELEVGMRATVQVDAFPGLELPARVSAVGAFANGGMRASYVRQIPLRLSLEQTDPRLVPDLAVSADLLLAQEADATMVPLECVFYEPDSKEPFAFVQSESGWEKRPVELGLTNHVAAAIRSGLEPGETVAAEWPGD